MLQICDVRKCFKDKVVLNDLTIQIQDASIFGLVGVNGAGKSTLLRSIAGIYRLDNGFVKFDGEDTYQNEMIRKQIFYVSDDSYFPLASNIDTLKDFYSSYYSLNEELVIKYLNLFRLNSKAQISSFSKGMKRLTMLAFALAIEPKLLLLDEAFDGLDPLVRHDLKKVLSDFIEDNKATVIISSHNLKELEDICDSYGILENGKIATYGDLLESKNNINKYQLAYKKEIDESLFLDFDVLYKKKEGSVYTLVMKGDSEEILKKLKKSKPLILDSLPVNFEELFIYEHERSKQ